MRFYAFIQNYALTIITTLSVSLLGSSIYFYRVSSLNHKLLKDNQKAIEDLLHSDNLKSNIVLHDTIYIDKIIERHHTKIVDKLVKVPYVSDSLKRVYQDEYKKFYHEKFNKTIKPYNDSIYLLKKYLAVNDLIFKKVTTLDLLGYAPRINKMAYNEIESLTNKRFRPQDYRSLDSTSVKVDDFKERYLLFVQNYNMLYFCYDKLNGGVGVENGQFVLIPELEKNINKWRRKEKRFYGPLELENSSRPRKTMP